MAISFQGKTKFVGQFVAATQSAAKAVVDSSIGSITLAFGQAVTGVALWLQAFVAQVLLLTRAATSKGADLDSWFADWGFTRLGAVAASDVATFSRATPTLQAVVPVGQAITTGPGGIQFNVGLDTTNAAYSASLNGYVLPISTASVTVPIQCATPGIIGNVLADTVASFLVPIAGVDSVTNPNDIENGTDAESDSAARARFPLWLASLRTSNDSAIKYAISSTPGVVRYSLVENLSYPDLETEAGWFFAIVDDGSGDPPDSLLAAVSTAVNATKAGGIQFSVYRPSLVTVDIDITVKLTAGYVGLVVQAVQSALTAFIATNPIAESSIDVSRLAQVAYEASPGVANVPFASVLINGENTDLAMTAIQAPAVGTITVTATS